MTIINALFFLFLHRPFGVGEDFFGGLSATSPRTLFLEKWAGGFGLRPTRRYQGTFRSNASRSPLGLCLYDR
jgi:hypothetical protein